MIYSWETCAFGELLAAPVRNGIYKKKEFHGRGQKIVNMGDLFSLDFISSQEMKRIELSDKELANSLVKDGDLLFARRSLILEGSGKCSLVVRPSEDTTFESSVIRARLNPNRGYPTLLLLHVSISSRTRFGILYNNRSGSFWYQG